MRSQSIPLSKTYNVNHATGAVSGTTLVRNRIRASIDDARVYPGASNCDHYKWLNTSNDVLAIYTGNLYAKSTVISEEFVPFSATLQGYNTGVPAQHRQAVQVALAKTTKDPFDNNDFELIPFLMDLDSTIAMFSAKFLRELSYGAITWGVLPFISDMKACLNSIKDLYRKAGSYCREVNRVLTGNFVSPEPTSLGAFECLTTTYTVRTKGRFTFTVPQVDNKIDRALYLLDELGVHPDLKTAWDIIPLSFVVDYFLPVGDILESLHPRGWSNSTVFEGSFSISCKHYYHYSYFVEGKQWASNHAPLVLQSYTRRNSRGHLAFSLPVEWSAPSDKELFNTAYLTTVLKRAF